MPVGFPIKRSQRFVSVMNLDLFLDGAGVGETLLMSQLGKE